MYWDQMTSKEIDNISRKTPVILPIAATEQHGAHLPLATDRLIGEHFCQELNRLIETQVLILPTVAIGCSEHHMDFRGTLSVQHNTFLRQLKDLAESVVQHGFHNLLLFNSHGGNQAIGQSFLEVFGHRHPRCRLVLATWWRIAHGELQSLTDTGPGGTGHAGEFETSLMLLIAPGLVHRDKISDRANTATFPWAEGDMLSGPSAFLYRSMKEMTPTGVFGEAGAASRAKGERITKVVVQALREIILDLIE